MADLSKKQKKVLAKAINSGGQIQVSRIHNLYSSDASDTIKSLVEDGWLIRHPTDPLEVLKVPKKDVNEDGGIDFRTPPEVLKMAKKLKKTEELKKQDKKVEKKLERLQKGIEKEKEE